MTDLGYGALQGMHVDAAGRITYDFDGHLHARGVDLDTGADVESYEPDRKITWFTPASADAADVYAYETERFLGELPDSSGLTLRALRPGALEQARVELFTFGQGVDTGAAVVATARDGAGGDHTVRLIDEQDASDFLQLAATQRLALDLGSSSATLANSNAVNVDVPHGLQRVPRFAAGSPKTSGLSCAVIAATVAAMTVRVFTTSGAVTTGTFGFYWIALG